MRSQQQADSSTDREANRQALRVVAIAGVTCCVLVLGLGMLVGSLGLQLYAWLLAQAPPPSRTGPAVLYVSSNGSGRACDSWEHACRLQTALASATAGDEIWVRAGLYRPASDARFPDSTFELKAGVALYGGFAGTETARSERNWQTHVTVLSGDLGGDDATDPNGVVTDTAKIVGMNAYHVVTGSGVDGTAVLDGFVITAGYASLTPPNIHGYGGGMYNWAASPTLNNLIFSGNTAGKGTAFYGGGGMINLRGSNPVLTNVTFTANTAGSGGGMYNDNSNPKLTRVTFTGNKAIDNGGMINYKSSNPILKDVTFSDNVAERNAGGMGNHTNGNPILNNVTFVHNSAGNYGGGMGNYQSNPILTDVEFSDNRAGLEGGGMHNSKSSQPILVNVTFVDNTTATNGGGMLNSESSPTLTNVTFSGNSAGQYGGGICNTFSSNPKLTNVTFAGNSAPHGSGVCNVGGGFKLVNGIVWGNTPGQEQVYDDHVFPDITYSDIQGGFPGAGNLNANPRLGAFGEYGGPTGLFPLLAGSPVIDQGSQSACPTADQLGLPRPVDGDRNGSAICDMGAFEYQASP